MRGRRPAAVLGEQMTSMAGKSGGPELGFGIFGDGGGWYLEKEQIIIIYYLILFFWHGVWDKDKPDVISFIFKIIKK